MRAIVLVGGGGTRLRPLTLRTPKALVPILNRPLLEHLLLHLREHGIERATLAMTQRNEAIRAALGDGAHLGMQLEYAYEDTPLGSGGAIASIAGGWDERFLVCNGDIITDLDVTGMLEAHIAAGAELTIALHEVDDPTGLGVVAQAGDGRITRFVEKPARAEDAPSRLVNAGHWIFEPHLLREMDATQFNRVEDDLFQRLVEGNRPMHGFDGRCYWVDVGNAGAYRRVNLELLAGAIPSRASGAEALLAEGAAVAPGARLEGGVIAGGDCAIMDGAAVHGSVLWDRVRIEEGATVRDSILATGVVVERGAVVDGAVVAHEVRVGAGARVAPGAMLEPGTVVGGTVST